jgi:hypothetical protein
MLQKPETKKKKKNQRKESVCEESSRTETCTSTGGKVEEADRGAGALSTV